MPIMFFPPAIRRITLGRCSRHQSTNAASKGSVFADDPHLPAIIFHPRPHGVPAALLHFRSHHPQLLNLFTYFALHIASALAIPVSRPVFLPTQRSLWTVPRGPFVHKKSQENFERKVHKRAIKAWDADPEVIGRWVQYLEAHPVSGVGMRVVRWERAPVGFGKLRLAGLTDELKELRRITDRGQVAALGEEIVKTETKAAIEHEAAVQ